MFHGVSDDFVEIAPCRAYFGRLKQAGKDVQMTEFADTWHVYDVPALPPTPIVVKNAETTHCVVKEEPLGTIINTATQKPFTHADGCVGRDPHVAYSESATHATEDAVKSLLKSVFKLE
jgi:hypothetical protein